MPTTTINGATVLVSDNFPKTTVSRKGEKARGKLPKDFVDTDDENQVVERTNANREQINRDFFAQRGLSSLSPPHLPGDVEYRHLQTLFGSGARGVGAFNTPETARRSVRSLSTNLVPPNESRTMHRGGSIEAGQIEALVRVLQHGDEEDNHTVSFIMLHGYQTVEGARSKVRPPSVSSDHEIGEVYASTRPPSLELRFFLTIKGETGNQRAALGASCPSQINAAGGQREFILDDRNTYFTTRVAQNSDRITLDIEVTGPSIIGDRARARASDPHDRASISPQALLAGRTAQRVREQRAKEKTYDDADLAAAAQASVRAMDEVKQDAKKNVAREAREYAQLHAGEPCLDDYDRRFTSLYDDYFAKHLPDAMKASFERLYSHLHDRYYRQRYDKHVHDHYDENLKNTPLW